MGPYEQKVEQEREFLMLSPAALIGDGVIGGGPHTRISDGKFENEGIVCAFVGARRTFWPR